MVWGKTTVICIHVQIHISQPRVGGFGAKREREWWGVLGGKTGEGGLCNSTLKPLPYLTFFLMDS